MPSVDDLTYALLNNGVIDRIANGSIPVSYTGTVTAVTLAATTTTTVLAGSGARIGAAFQNNSGATINIKLGAGASATSYTIALANGAYYEVPFKYVGDITAFTTTASVSPHLLVTNLT